MRASRSIFFRSALVLVVAAALAGPTPAKAGFQLVLSPNSLGANDAASWSGFDANNPTIVSTNGINIKAQGSGTGYSTFGPTTLSGYPAIEASGGEVYGEYTTESAASITFTFSQPVAAAGAFMEAFAEITGYEDSWPFQVTAEDSNGNFQSFSLSYSGAPLSFVGIVSDTGNLSRLEISTYGYQTNVQVDVGPLELLDSPPVSGVPAPSSFTLASLGAVVLLGCRSWRRWRSAIA
jgi:hypothetical protein